MSRMIVAQKAEAPVFSRANLGDAIAMYYRCSKGHLHVIASKAAIGQSFGEVKIVQLGSDGNP